MNELPIAFPSGSFNCWGIPPGAEPAFLNAQIGDLVLIIPLIGMHGGGIRQIGIVKAKIPTRCYDASRYYGQIRLIEDYFHILFSSIAKLVIVIGILFSMILVTTIGGIHVGGIGL